MTQFKHEGVKYEILVPAIIWNKKKYTAEELVLADNKTTLDELVAHSWNGPDGRRDESEYEANGIFKVIYEAEPAKDAKVK